MPNSYEDVYNYTKDGNYPVYNYFFGNRERGENAYILQDSLNLNLQQFHGLVEVHVSHGKRI